MSETAIGTFVRPAGLATAGDIAKAWHKSFKDCNQGSNGEGKYALENSPATSLIISFRACHWNYPIWRAGRQPYFGPKRTFPYCINPMYLHIDFQALADHHVEMVQVQGSQRGFYTYN